MLEDGVVPLAVLLEDLRFCAACSAMYWTMCLGTSGTSGFRG
jgi:hypothetical protein